MLEPTAVALQAAFLAVLYLFILWVARSSLRDLRRPDEARVVVPPPAAGADVDVTHAGSAGDRRRG